MKKIFQTIGLITLICFSFFYTNKATTVLKEQDPLMIEIESKQEKYNIDPIKAIIIDDEIVPGIYGKKINIIKSYNNMKNNNMFNERLIIYDEIIPDISLSNQKDKYIINGNRHINKISLIFIIENNQYLDKLINLLDKKNTNSNLFMNINYLNNNITNLYKIKNNHEIYNYGNNGIYKKDYIILGNNIINRNTNNSSTYCLFMNKNQDNLDICSKNNMHTILAKKVINNNPYNSISKNIKNGDILILELNNNLLNELNIIIDFINKKGIEIVKLSNLLNERNK